MQKYLQDFQKLNFYSRKTENVQNLKNDIRAKIDAKFFSKIVQSASLHSRFFKEL